MRHVQLDEFLRMPEGTVYMLDTDNVGGANNVYDLVRPLQIKGWSSETTNDWAVFDLIELQDVTDCGQLGEQMDLMHQHGQSAAVDAEPVGCRYGGYPEQGEVAFYVLDEQDTRAVIGLLETALKWRKEASK